MAQKPMKRPTQFSKRMTVTAVASAVIVAIGTELILWRMGDAAGIVAVCRSLILFAGLVFTAYCGNSAVEKWALSRWGGGREEEQSNG